MGLTTKLIIAALSGGSLTAAGRWVLSYAGLVQNAQDQFRDDLMGRISALEERQRMLEECLEEERRARVRAELRNEVLLQRIRRLVESLNEMREKENLPPVDLKDFTITELDRTDNDVPDA